MPEVRRSALMHGKIEFLNLKVGFVYFFIMLLGGVGKWYFICGLGLAHSLMRHG